MAEGLVIFQEQVREILSHHCLICHLGEDAESEFDLATRESLLRGGAAGPVVTPGDAAASRLIQLVSHAEESTMPAEGSKLSDDDIAHLAAWIDRGAPYDRPLQDESTDSGSWIDRTPPESAREFWSFQPLAKATPPEEYSQAGESAIDAFIQDRLANEELSLNPPADRRTWIRRAYFDLIGLPPTPEEVAAFIDDASPDAYEKVVDRLLASPHYGERWGRHWLDVARFAESHGFEHDYDRPGAYHYRDFVIRALNDDMPYDQFVRWQLAGDESAPDEPLALMATGFLAAGVHSTQITKNEVEKHRYDEMDDMLATTGTAMLGLTIGCARCHDHKFDPIPQRDYYRMLSTFTTTVRSELELDLQPEEFRRAKEAFDAEHAKLVVPLQEFESRRLAERFDAWDQARSEDWRPDWVVPDLEQSHAESGASFEKLEDGSLLVGGAEAESDVYTFTTRSFSGPLRAVRIEALSHSSLKQGGPGRSAEGGFALNDLRLAVVAGDAEPVEVRLVDARASQEQPDGPAKAAIDDDAESAWGVDDQIGQDHQAAFMVEEPLELAADASLRITLSFQGGAGRALGRLRISASTTDAQPPLDAPAASADVLRRLARPTAERDDDDRTAILAWYRTIDPVWCELHARVTEHAKSEPKPNLTQVLVASEGLPPIRLHTQGEEFFPETYFLKRGNPDDKVAVAPPGYLQVLMPLGDQGERWDVAPPDGWRTSYRRTALANWIADVDQGAGSLLARVIVNRMWRHHFGRGIVATPSDFGASGAPPTHPELLDWLARRLIEGGWRLKPLHKLMMTSAAYRQSAAFDEAKAARDPDNTLYWRWSTRRLEAEVIRDAMLSTSGALDTTMFGPGTLEESSRRRSIYFTVKRSKLIPMLHVFDAPDALQGVAMRDATTVAPQALVLMNHPETRAMAERFAERVAPTDKTSLVDAVEQAYQITLTRPPTPSEATQAIEFLEGQSASHDDDEHAARRMALADFCQVLFGLNEFIYVE